MTSPRGLYPALVIALAAVLLLGAPTSILAQNGNETGLPLYPNATTGKQYPTNSEGYAIYTAESHDTLDTVEDWYRHALPEGKENPGQQPVDSWDRAHKRERQGARVPARQ